MAPPDFTLIVDTREQRPFNFTKYPVEVQRAKLDAGDYSIAGHEHQIALERKSMADLVSTVTVGHKRFKKEIERSLGYAYFGIIVEEPFTMLLHDAYKGAKHNKTAGEVVAKIVNAIRVKYNVDVMFCMDEAEAASLTYHILASYWRNREHREGATCHIQDTSTRKSRLLTGTGTSFK